MAQALIGKDEARTYLEVAEHLGLHVGTVYRHLSRIKQNHPNVYAAVMGYGAQADVGLLLSDDSGSSWTPLDFVLGDDAIGYIILHPEDQNTMYLGSYGENLYMATNRGAAWQQLADSGVPQQP